MRIGIPPALLRRPLRGVSTWTWGPEVDWPTARGRLERATAFPPPRGTQEQAITLGGVAGLELVAPGVDPRRTILYFHGGGYTVGSARSHAALTARLGAAADARVCSLDYRRGPEHRHPAALEDALAAYRALLEDGFPPERIAFAGDSAGGGLSIAAALTLRDDGLPLPACLGLICPWADAGPDLAGTRVSGPRDAVLDAATLRRFTDSYAPGADADDPRLSPVRADLTGLPPIVMDSGGDDTLIADARAVEAGARAAGVELVHRSYPGLWHVFHAAGPLMSGAGHDALNRFGADLGRRLAP